MRKVEGSMVLSPNQEPECRAFSAAAFLTGIAALNIASDVLALPPDPLATGGNIVSETLGCENGNWCRW